MHDGIKWLGKRSIDYYANRVVQIAIKDPHVDAGSNDDLEPYVRDWADDLCLDADELWNRVVKFQQTTGNFYKANSRLA